MLPYRCVGPLLLVRKKTLRRRAPVLLRRERFLLLEAQGPPVVRDKKVCYAKKCEMAGSALKNPTQKRVIRARFCVGFFKKQGSKKVKRKK
jgi:hypothetical protein